MSFGRSGSGSPGCLRRCGTPGCTLPDFHAGMHMGDEPLSAKRASAARSPGALSVGSAKRGRARSTSPLQPPVAKRPAETPYGAPSPLNPSART